MCGIGGIISLNQFARPTNSEQLEVINELLAHRGPDAEGIWCADNGRVGLAHRRLEIIDLSQAGSQPMSSANGAKLVFNGEIYNYLELREELKGSWNFRSHTDTETILAAYARYGVDCLAHLRGMFAFALWDEKRDCLFAARDRLGIKPFYYTITDDRLIFASEIKALLPFLKEIRTDREALAQYFAFQFTIGRRTLFEDVYSLAPGEFMLIEAGKVKVQRYWDIHFRADQDHTPKYFYEQLCALMDESIRLHLRADTPIGSYLSGGIDSSLVAMLASRHGPQNREAFHGRFTDYAGYDESGFAQEVAKSSGKLLRVIDITPHDFLANIERVIYHLDQPTAGPGSFPQYMVSQLSAQHVKVVLGGQGGDEIFAGYARYLIAYFEQCLKAAIDGTYKDGRFVVTPESIIPNLGALREYKPLLKGFWQEGLFEDLDRRYLRLVDRSADMDGEIDSSCLDQESITRAFNDIFNDERNVHNRAYLDKMCHFDFKTLLPALLHVEDRMSMAHGLESRVPLLDHKLVEFVATVPANVKFRDGQLKVMLRETFAHILPEAIVKRRDKMGFPVPLNEWYQKELFEFMHDLFATRRARERDIFRTDKILERIAGSQRFSRRLWGLLCLELWHHQFHDRAAEYRSMLSNRTKHFSNAALVG